MPSQNLYLKKKKKKKEKTNPFKIGQIKMCREKSITQSSENNNFLLNQLYLVQ